MVTKIPVIDFENYGLHVENECDISNEDIKSIGDEVYDAFRTIGFCYIKNHGISPDLISKMFKISKEFFELPTKSKMKVLRSTSTNHGWVDPGRERLNPKRPADFKEAFNFTPCNDGNWPDSEIPEMKKCFADFFEECKKITFRILDVLAVGLKLEDRNFLRNCHKYIGEKNQTTVRSLFYPAIPEDEIMPPGQVRCGEHSDYGTVTVLFQDDIGGLEVCNTDGDYIQATPVPGAICVNIGDLMQRWTADKLLATKHRVLIPTEERLRKTGRQSIAFFIQPDDDYVIKCIDGSDKYQPISSLDYLNWRFGETYF